MKDKNIQQLFDNYAEGLPSQEQLSAKAREQMTASARAKRKMPWWNVALATCCLVVFVVVLGVAANGLLGPTNTDPTVFVYGSADVFGKAVERSAVESVLPLEKIEENYIIVYQKYSAFYFKNSDELAYVRAVLGVYTENGMVELNVIAEVDGSVHSNYLTDYNNYIAGYGSFVTVDSGKGEYVTHAYLQSQQLHYYIQADSCIGASAEADNIVSLFA